jgi:molybdenum cofactor biosynthesis enzyme MoaA
MEGQNIGDIIPLVALTKELPVSVRFIEEMPFNGAGNSHSGAHWDYIRILQLIKEQYPDIKKIPDPPHSTSYNYQIPRSQGQRRHYSRLYPLLLRHLQPYPNYATGHAQNLPLR